MSVPLLARDQAALVEAIARRVVELLDERDAQPTPQLVDAATLAPMLGVSRSTVYERAAELGAIEVGDGPKPRLRFDVERAREAWSRRVRHGESQVPETSAVAGVRRRRRHGTSGSGVRLLPVRPRNDRPERSTA